MVRKVLLLYNTPKARRYFRALESGVAGIDIRVRPLLVTGDGPSLGPFHAAATAAYSLRRKRVRHRIPRWRMRLLEAAHLRAASGHFNWAWREIRRHGADAIGVWGGHAVDVRAARVAARGLGVPAFVFETGLLPGTTTCDPRGVNFRNSVPRDPAFYAAYHGEARLPEQLVQRPSRVEHARVALPDDYLFVPFQVALDSQVILYSPWIRDMRHLYDVVLESWRAHLAGRGIALVFKVHPSAPERYPDLRAAAARERGVVFADGNPTQELIDGARGVITINSTVGIEALLRQRPVMALGKACYAIPGVAERATDVAALGAWMQALAAGAAPAARHRHAFLHYLARDYCIPQPHRAPGPEHFRAIAARLQGADALAAAAAPD